MDTVVIILGLLTLILSIVVSRCFPKREAVGKMPPGFKSPVLAFEFIRNQHELTALFAINPPEKRQETIKHVNKGNRLDFGFALMYSLLAATLAYFLLDKTRLSAPWHGLITGAAVVSALVAGGSDMLENTILLRIADKQSLSAKPDEFRQLTRFVTIKFTMLTLSLALTLPFWFELIQDGKVVFKIWSGLTIVLIVAGLTGAFLSIFRLDLRHLSNAEPLIPNLLTLCVMYKYSILSFDGGGIRGIIPGQVMVTLEAKLAERVAQNPSLKLLYPNEVRLADFFDFFAGTSTGGILTSLYLCPDPKNLTRPRFSAQEAVNLYLEYGDDIFEVSVWKKIASGDGPRFGRGDEGEPGRRRHREREAVVAPTPPERSPGFEMGVGESPSGQCLPGPVARLLQRRRPGEARSDHLAQIGQGLGQLRARQALVAYLRHHGRIGSIVGLRPDGAHGAGQKRDKGKGRERHRGRRSKSHERTSGR